METEVVRVELGDRSYDIAIGLGTVAELPSRMAGLGLAQDVFVVTSPTVRSCCGGPVAAALDQAGLRWEWCEFQDDEERKCLATYEQVLAALMAFDEGRRVCLVALGGGVVGDLSGFVAATYKRGAATELVQVPTTLLGHVDCSVGGKTGVNLRDAKNMVGAFYQPRLVLIDLAFLGTLPRRELMSGLAEVIKHGVIFDEALFAFCETHIDAILRAEPEAIRRVSADSCRMKAGVVAQDELDSKGVRAWLNLGHTVGHAVEGATGGALYTHGEAVAIGMAAAARISQRMDMLDPGSVGRIVALLHRAGYDLTVRGCTLEQIMAFMRHDKKAAEGQVRVVLPTRIGEVALVDRVPMDVVEQVVREALAE